MLHAENNNMAPSVETMALPCNTNSLLNAAVAENKLPQSTTEEDMRVTTSSSLISTAQKPTAKSMDKAAKAAIGTYATPKRPGGTSVVTPGDEADTNNNNEAPTEQNMSEARKVSIATSTTSTTDNNSMAPPPTVATNQTVAVAAAVAKSTVQKLSKAIPAPTIKLDPRVSPRSAAPKTVVKPATAGKQVEPRSLEGVLKKGESATAIRQNQQQYQQQLHLPKVQPQQLLGATLVDTSKLSAVAELAAAAAQAAVQGGGLSASLCSTTPTAITKTISNIPPPSSFLAAQISPLRSSSRKNKGSKMKEILAAETATDDSPRRSETPPPSDNDANGGQTKLSPGMFQYPSTPKAQFMSGQPHTTSKVQNMSSGMTPRGLTAGLTPTMNFAMDFGKGNNRREDGTPLDAGNVFAMLQSPGGQGLFSPTGGLNSYSGANTPRGMYGFNGPIKLEAGGDVGINTPKIPANQQSMISISPLASMKAGGRNKQSAGAAAAASHTMGAPDTPGSINFSEVFADSPVKKDGGASALHSAQGAIHLDDDLNALLQLAEHATPGGGGGSRPIQFMSPLLANSLRRATSEQPTPSEIHLPMISGPSISPKFGRSASASGAGGRNNFSPPLLSIRSSSAAPVGGARASTRKKRAKRKTPTDVTSDEFYGQHHHEQQQQQLHPAGYGHPSMTHYHHPHMAAHPSAAHHPYYQQHPGYHGGQPVSHHPHAGYGYPGQPAPQQQHYDYPDQYHHQQEEDDGSTEDPSPAEQPAKKKGRGRGRPKGSTSKQPRQRGRPRKDGTPAQPKRTRRKASQPKTAVAQPVVSRPAPSSLRRGEPSALVGQSIADKVKTSRRSPPTIQSAPIPEVEPEWAPAPAKRQRSRKTMPKKAAAKPVKRKRTSTNDNSVSSPSDARRINDAIHAVNVLYGRDKKKKLQEATLRGVTCRPSGKWQAQLYFSGKSRYIGVFDNKEKASLAYEIAREVLKADDLEASSMNQDDVKNAVDLARKAAHAGIVDLDE